MEKMAIASFALLITSLIVSAKQTETRVEAGVEIASLVDFHQQNPEYLWPTNGVLSSEFGPRSGSFHYGIDIAGRAGRLVQAVAPGQVYYAGSARGYGKIVIIEHLDHSCSYYAHLKSIQVRWGQKINAGDGVGTIGATGHASGPHLHFEWRNAAGKAIDPLQMLEPPPSSFFVLKVGFSYDYLPLSDEDRNYI